MTTSQNNEVRRRGRYNRKATVNVPEEVDRLVNENMQLAKYFAAKWSGPGNIDYEEAFSRAMAGLLRAAELFDPAHGKFGTYAAWHIKSVLGRFFTNLKRLKRGGGTAIHIHLDAPLPNGSTLADMIPDESTDTSGHRMFSADETKQSVRTWLDALDEREQAIIRARFGLDGGQSQTLEQIALRYGLTRERIRQIEKKAMERLHSAAIGRHMRPKKKTAPPKVPAEQRFHRDRWSATRTAIDALAEGASVQVPLTERNNATTSIQRLRFAYGGQRKFRMFETQDAITVERLAA